MALLEKIISITFLFILLQETRQQSHMVYIDHEDNSNIFYDRLVVIYLAKKNCSCRNKTFDIVATGVLIDKKRVLTSYNPFRVLLNDSKELPYLYVNVLHERVYSKVSISNRFYSWISRSDTKPKYHLKRWTEHYQWKDKRYVCNVRKPACARPLIPLTDEEMSEDQWHGSDKEYSPLHDILVLRLHQKVHLNFTYNCDQNACPLPDFELHRKKLNRKTSKAFITEQFGPIKTDIATPNDAFNPKFSSVVGIQLRGGFTPVNEIPYNFLEHRTYAHYDDMQVDCGAFLPRNWGYFICLKLDPAFAKFNSGSMLFSNNKLFGIASFAMWKNRKSIAVFTDVRPYTELINKTCTKVDELYYSEP